MACYGIKYADNLPEGHDFVLVKTPDRVVIVYREDAVCPKVLEDSWAAFRALMRPELRAVV